MSRASIPRVPAASSSAYIDARQVFSRLDELFGPDGWQTGYRVLDAASGAIECTLTIAGISKSDVGYPNRSGGEEPLKAAYSDATKRAAVQWGIGRWLYALPSRWSALDEHGRPVDGERRPVASGQQPAPGEQNRQPPTEYRPPATEHQPPPNGNGSGNDEATPSSGPSLSGCVRPKAKTPRPGRPTRNRRPPRPSRS